MFTQTKKRHNLCSKLALISIAATLHLAPIQSNAAPVQPRIVGGTVVPQGDWPWMAALVGAGGNAYTHQFCGGSLISAEWILTAAHCVENATASGIEAIVGINNLRRESSESAAKRHEVAEIIIHPGYNLDAGLGEQNFDYDVALLRLSTPSNVTPLKLADAAAMSSLPIGSSMTIMGWGARNDNGTNFPDRLQEATVPLVAQLICNDAYFGEITDNMICAGFPFGGVDACVGDSGGPMVAHVNGHWQQIGITSFGAGCAQPDAFGVYARVPAVGDFLASLMDAPQFDDNGAFGNVGQGKTKQRQFSLTNNKPFSSVSVLSLSITGLNANDFSISSNNCLTGQLAAGADCQVTVSYTAGQVVGSSVAALQAQLSDGSTPSAALTAQALALSALGDALDAENLDWYTGGDAQWFTASDSQAQGGSAARSGYIHNRRSTSLMTYVQGPATLSYRRRTSSELPDILSVAINGIEVDELSGLQPWFDSPTISLGAGCHEITWTYAKDVLLIQGADAAYVDDINVQPVSAGVGNCERATAVPTVTTPDPTDDDDTRPEPNNTSSNPPNTGSSQSGGSTSASSAGASASSGGGGAAFWMLMLLVIVGSGRLASNAGRRGCRYC